MILNYLLIINHCHHSTIDSYSSSFLHKLILHKNLKIYLIFIFILFSAFHFHCLFSCISHFAGSCWCGRFAGFGCALVVGLWLLVGFWEGERLAGAISVAFSNMPNDRIAFITSMGGNTLITDDNLTQFKSLLKSFGATKIQGCVRKSVARLLRRLDFKERYILVERPL